jgi:hypothetical protein
VIYLFRTDRTILDLEKAAVQEWELDPQKMDIFRMTQAKCLERIADYNPFVGSFLVYDRRTGFPLVDSSDDEL